MEQVDGGDLIVNRGDESKVKSAKGDKRNMDLVESLDTARKLAKASSQPYLTVLLDMSGRRLSMTSLRALHPTTKRRTKQT